MNLTKEEAEIEATALEFAKRNKKPIARRIASKEIYQPEDEPVSVFMAGSPGAGKTEASIELLETFKEQRVLRIDPDELRAEFDGYTGDNSYLFQKGVSVLVEKIHDLVLDQKQSFLMDGTLANFRIAEKNISRSLKKGRMVQILYVYQDPMLAWDFVQAREAQEGRRIPVDGFVEQYFAARDTVNQLKEAFGRDLRVDLLIKNFDNSNRAYKANIDVIDNHVREKYTRRALERALGVDSPEQV